MNYYEKYIENLDNVKQVYIIDINNELKHIENILNKYIKDNELFLFTRDKRLPILVKEIMHGDISKKPYYPYKCMYIFVNCILFLIYSKSDLPHLFNKNIIIERTWCESDLFSFGYDVECNVMEDIIEDYLVDNGYDKFYIANDIVEIKKYLINIFNFINLKYIKNDFNYIYQINIDSPYIHILKYEDIRTYRHDEAEHYINPIKNSYLYGKGY
jgi:hypothetical protein